MFSLEFLVTSLVVVLIPGTGVIYTVSVGLTQGKKASVIAALGGTVGIIPHLAATILGLAALMHSSAVAFHLLKYAGVLYLFYIAYTTWRDRSAFQVDEVHTSASAYRIMLKALLMNILNPKLTIFFLAFLPQFVPHGALHPMIDLLKLSMAFMVMTFVVFVGYGLLAHTFRVAVIESRCVQNWLRRGFAAAFVGLAVNLAFTEK